MRHEDFPALSLISKPAELRTIPVDRTRPPEERLHRYIQAVGDPYRFKVGDITVKVVFSPEGRPFPEAVAAALLAG